MCETITFLGIYVGESNQKFGGFGEHPQHFEGGSLRASRRVGFFLGTPPNGFRFPLGFPVKCH